MLKPEDLYNEIEKAHLTRLYLSSSYQTTERWIKESLQFKVLLDFLVGGDISSYSPFFTNGSEGWIRTNISLINSQAHCHYGTSD